MVDLFGLATCDTTRKARRWLADKGVAHVFHDVRADGVDEALLRGWARRIGWRSLLNTSSTTWRALGESDKAGLEEDRAVALMLAHPTLIKRPVLVVKGEAAAAGFRPEAYAAVLEV